MDVVGAVIRAVVCASFAAFAGVALAQPVPESTGVVLRSQGWTETSSAGFQSYLSEPPECLARSQAADAFAPIAAGRALFRSPALFGGPAARVGLSCNACHAGGRVNHAFLLPELGDRVGHADVTSEWSSKTLGDGVPNPVPIPDLAGAAARPHFGSVKIPSLNAFIRRVIEEEFQGPPPPPEALDALTTYVRALNPVACPNGDAALTLEAAAQDVREALSASLAYGQRGAGSTSSLLLLSAQDGVARIVERLPEPHFARDRRALFLLSRELGALRAGGLDAAAATGWRVRFDVAIQRIAARSRATYFDGATLARALRERR